MSKLSVGIIGAGYWGPNLVRNFSACPLTSVAAVCDANPARLAAIGRQFGHLKLVGSVDELLEMDVQAVAIATPVSSHYALGKRCLEAGKHVLIEKPLAASASEAQALTDLAARMNRVLMVDHTYLFNPAVRKIKQIIDSGELGDLYYIDSIRVNLGLFQHDVNVVWDLAPHDLSIVHHIVGGHARGISAWGCAHANAGQEDVAYVNVDYGDSLLATFHVNWLSPVKIRQMIFAGSKKSLIFNELNSTEPVKVYDRGIELSAGEPTAEDRRRLLVGYRSGDCWSPHIEPGEALQAVVRHFADCILSGAAPISDGRLGTRVVQLLEAATGSIRDQGRRIALTNETPVNGNGNGHANGDGNGDGHGNGKVTSAGVESPSLARSL